MKPEWLCTRLSPDLWSSLDDREGAAQICFQCPARVTCLYDAIKEKTVEQVRGGFWFTSTGRQSGIDSMPPRPEPRRYLTDENKMEKLVADLVAARKLRETVPDLIPNRHGRWKRGRSCQQESRRHGDPCVDVICKEIARGQERQNTRKYRRKKAA